MKQRKPTKRRPAPKAAIDYARADIVKEFKRMNREEARDEGWSPARAARELKKSMKDVDWVLWCIGLLRNRRN